MGACRGCQRTIPDDGRLRCTPCRLGVWRVLGMVGLLSAGVGAAAAASAGHIVVALGLGALSGVTWWRGRHNIQREEGAFRAIENRVSARVLAGGRSTGKLLAAPSDGVPSGIVTEQGPASDAPRTTLELER